jgi:hypothetical protein
MSQEAQEHPADVQKLIEDFQRSEGHYRFARWTVTFLVIATVVAHIYGLWGVIRDFRDNRTGEFAEALCAEAVIMAPAITEDASVMAERLYPHYAEAFQTTFERDWPKIQAQAHQEMELLDAHAQSQWPAITNGLMQIFLSSEDILAEELGTIMPPDDANRILDAYGEALLAEYETLIEEDLREHSELADEIGVLLEQLVATEPDIQHPVDMQSTIGMMLELVGTELQKDIDSGEDL